MHASQPSTQPPPADPRRAVIQAAAFEVFASYGYRRTSMEDIARKAGMSRALLYQHFSNKEDIFRSLVQSYFETAEDQVRTILGHPSAITAEGFADSLRAAFHAKAGPMMEAVLSSPHGAELLDPGNSNCTDLVTAGEASMVAVFADWLTRASQAGSIALSPFGSAEETARTMLAAVAGLKIAGTPLPVFHAASDRLAALFAKGLAR